jgi:hypothetical protein
MKLLVLVTTLLFASISQATLITFDEKVSVENVFTNDGQSIDSAGFSFFSGMAEGNSGFIEVGLPRSLGGLFNANGSNITMRATDNSTFDLSSFDISRRDGDISYGRSASDVVVIGNLLGGGTVEFRTGALQINFAASLLPSTFKNLTSVIFNPEKFDNAGDFDYEFVIDNINTTSVSTPATFALILCGIVAIRVGAKRRKV